MEEGEDVHLIMRGVCVYGKRLVAPIGSLPNHSHCKWQSCSVYSVTHVHTDDLKPIIQPLITAYNVH